MDGATIAEIIGILTEVKELIGEDDPMATLTDGILGNNDLEKMLMYDKDNTALSEMSSRLEVIDKRLDCTNQLLSHGFGFICTFVFVACAFKFLNWIYSVLGV